MCILLCNCKQKSFLNDSFVKNKLLFKLLNEMLMTNLIVCFYDWCQNKTCHLKKRLFVNIAP